MSPLIPLGLKLARAGGRFRILAIAAGTALSALLLLTGLALPTAMQPDPILRQGNWLINSLVLAAVIIPAAILLIVVGRLSSGIRDQRLAALRLIGVTPKQARTVAAVENGVLALAGAVAGFLLFAVIAPLLQRFGLPGFGHFPGQFATTLLQNLGSIVALTAISIAVGTSATWDHSAAKTAKTAKTARTQPSLAWWRPILFLAALATLIVLQFIPVNLDNPGPIGITWLVATAIGTIGIALLTPFLTNGIASFWGRRSGSLAVRLGVRAIQADAVSSARVVAGLAVAVVITVTLLGLLASIADSGFRRALRAVGAGPQQILIWEDSDGGDEATAYPEVALLGGLNPDAATSFQQTPGVIGFLPVRGANALIPVPTDTETCPWSGELAITDPQCHGNLALVASDVAWPLPSFIGTCQELTNLLALDKLTATGCDDNQPALILGADGQALNAIGRVYYSALPPTFDAVMTPFTAVPPGVALVTDTAGNNPVLPLGTFDTHGRVITALGSSDLVGQTLPVAFIPAALANQRLVDLGVLSGLEIGTRWDIIADGGTIPLAAVNQTAAQFGWHAETVTSEEYRIFAAFRAMMYGLSGIALAVSLITVALTATDRAIERRRNVARQIAIGVPMRVLTIGQLIQVILPAVIASAIALGFSALGLRVVSRTMLNIAAYTAPWGALIGIIASGILIVALATVPLTRTKITPELLRRE
ncbi:MAG: FtsX-like permease family protein [Cellulomonadaceae bacterium]|jgi:hypothetical protein|nr:FtsX-like permease family protein [Cellulomonadaceae bacterium]